VVDFESLHVSKEVHLKTYTQFLIQLKKGYFDESDDTSLHNLYFLEKWQDILHFYILSQKLEECFPWFHVKTTPIEYTSAQECLSDTCHRSKHCCLSSPSEFKTQIQVDYLTTKINLSVVKPFLLSLWHRDRR